MTAAKNIRKYWWNISSFFVKCFVANVFPKCIHLNINYWTHTVHLYLAAWEIVWVAFDLSCWKSLLEGYSVESVEPELKFTWINKLFQNAKLLCKQLFHQTWKKSEFAGVRPINITSSPRIADCLWCCDIDGDFFLMLFKLLCPIRSLLQINPLLVLWAVMWCNYIQYIYTRRMFSKIFSSWGKIVPTHNSPWNQNVLFYLFVYIANKWLQSSMQSSLRKDLSVL